MKYKTKESTRKAVEKYNNKYPEKTAAKSEFNGRYRELNKEKSKGYEFHHWSYNPEHTLDVIRLTKQQHEKVHQYLEYDEVTKMYKDKKSGFLLNTKSLHAAFISLVLEHY